MRQVAVSHGALSPLRPSRGLPTLLRRLPPHSKGRPETWGLRNGLPQLGASLDGCRSHGRLLDGLPVGLKSPQLLNKPCHLLIQTKECLGELPISTFGRRRGAGLDQACFHRSSSSCLLRGQRREPLSYTARRRHGALRCNRLHFSKAVQCPEGGMWHRFRSEIKVSENKSRSRGLANDASRDCIKHSVG